jgi:hypothetical protein
LLHRLSTSLRLLMLLGLMASSSIKAKAADYVVITKQVEVNRPVVDVWKRVGGYCAIAEWLKVTCEYVSGSGDLGSIRKINGTNLEPMVAKTATSYTYWQSAGNMAPMSYHGTLAAEPNGAGKSRLIYTLFYDQAAMASDAVRASEHERLSTRFQEALDTMKALAEAH